MNYQLADLQDGIYQMNLGSLMNPLMGEHTYIIKDGREVGTFNGRGIFKLQDRKWNGSSVMSLVFISAIPAEFAS